MYNTSANYKIEIAKKSIDYAWYGTITLTSGYVVKFGSVDASTGAQRINNLDQNKSKITKQYTQGETLQIGIVFSSQLVLGLRDTADLQVSDHHYEFYGAVIDIRFRLYGDTLANTETGTNKKYEDVPCGLFTVEKAEFTYHTVLLTAYDNLYKAAKTNITAKLSNSAAYTALSSLCNALNVTLATTQLEIEAMPNGTTSWSLSSFKKGTAIKDIIEELCTCLCANAVCDRSGQIVIKPYTTATVRTVGDSNRYSSSYIDYLGRYTRIALENADGDEEVYAATTTYNTGKPLTLSIGKNTLINKKNLSNRSTIAKAIIDNLATVMYAPLDIDIPSDPSIDIGDSITGTHINGNTTETYTFINTKDDLALYGKQKITSSGGNYELANRKKSTKTEKKISDLDQQTVELGNNMAIVQTEISNISGMMNVGYILPIRIDGSDIPDGQMHQVLEFEFVIDEPEEPAEGEETEEDVGQAISFYAQFCFYVDTTATANVSYGDGIVTVTYTMDGVDTASSVYSYGDGWKILTLNGFFPSLTPGTHNFIVSMSASGGAVHDPT